MYFTQYMGPGMMGWGHSSLLWFAPLAILIGLWSIFWKGLALWHSAKRDQGWWFIILLIVNTAGILEIIYLFGVLKLKTQDLFEHKIVTKTDSMKTETKTTTESTEMPPQNPEQM